MPNNIVANTAPGPQNPAVETATINTSWIQPKQLSQGDGAGVIMGQGAADLIQFFSNWPAAGQQAPISQPAGGFVVQASSFAQGGGVIETLGTSQAPVSVAANSTHEYSMTLLPATAIVTVGTGDMVYVNKPTAQANLGVGNVRVSAANIVGLTFSNTSTAATTPTASEKYGFVILKNMLTITQSLTPAFVAPSTTAEQQFTVTGLIAGQVVQVMKPSAQAGLDIVGSRIVANNTLGITFLNASAASITPTAAESYTMFAMPGLGISTNTILTQPQVSSTGVGLAANTMTEIVLTEAGLATTDTVIGVSKPTLQQAMPVQGRVSAAGVLAVAMANVSSGTVTPTVSEIYGVTIYRPSPATPMVQYAPALAPVSIAAATSAEQIFAVTGVVASSMVWVNKPSFTAGVGVAGVRATSNANQIGITFINPTASAVVLPAETYLVAGFSQPIPDVNVSWIYSAVPSDIQQRTLLGAMRNALVALGLTANY